MRIFLMLGSISGFLAVAAGAFGAHALQSQLSPDMLEVWKTAAHYQLVHSVMVVVAGVAGFSRASRALLWAGWLFVVGVVLFSGSLYALALTGMRVLGAVTPFGGLCFLGGWLALVVYASQIKTT